MSTPRVSRVRSGHASRRTQLTVIALACALYQGAACAAGVMALTVAQAAAPATQSAVADAVMRRDAAGLKKLMASRADVNAAQPDGTTALHWAAYHRDTDAAKALLAKGASPSAVTSTGMTPLALACESGNADLVRLLLKARADPNQTLGNGETPL